MVEDWPLARQIWDTSSRPASLKTLATTTTPATTQAQSALCTVALAAGGTIRFNDSYSTILSDSVTFESPCDNNGLHRCQNSGNSTVVKFDDPFYASVAPQIYALATATVVSYMLVILIFITPRTFYVGGPGGRAGFLGLRNIVPKSGNSNVISVGRRPLLQKIAAVTVAVSLTIATTDTFEVAKGQYNDGLMDSQQLVENVIGSVEIRVVRVVSDTFLWLAQVQTLIRLFPRHKEKVTIKWLGFALVTCDTVFSILENFVSHTTLTRPRSFQDAIPALSYLFQMAISLIYASCVIYYSLSKRRFAFWHSKMKNICLVAVLSLASVLVPVVFFVLDVSQPNIATWGEYIQWVGAAAASVVVWEWVERIEALERDERKDGILGREIFDGDEMLDITPDHKSSSTSNYFGFGKRSSSDDNKRVSMMPIPSIRPRVAFHKRRGVKHDMEKTHTTSLPHNEANAANGLVTRPTQVATPISRSDTTSAASTLYAVRYQNVSSPSPAIPEEPSEAENRVRQPSVQINGHGPPVQEAEGSTLARNIREEDVKNDTQDTRDSSRNRQVWQAVANPFKRKRAEPPAEVAAQMTASNTRRSPAEHYHNLKERINAFRAVPITRLSGRQRSGPSPPMPVTIIPVQPRPSRLEVPEEETRSSSPRRSLRSSLVRGSSTSSRSRQENLPVTVIPAPTRGGRTWSPADLRDDTQQTSPQSQRQALGVDTSPRNQAQGTPAPTNQNDPSVHVARGALTIAESPIRAMEHDNRNSPGFQRQYGRLRAPTIDSLNDRLSSTSPGSATPRSASGQINSEGCRQSPIDSPSPRPPPDQSSLSSRRNSPLDRSSPRERTLQGKAN